VKAPEPKVDLATMPEADRKAWLMKKGEEVYTTGGSGGIACVTCHQATGAGLPPSFPPLVGQKDFMGDCVRHAGFVVHGLTGKITIGGTDYNGAMPSQPTLSDEEIAAAITYERNSWGNDFGICMPEDVAKARSAPPPQP
jgi:mono/diheme cytochrome c family protein